MNVQWFNRSTGQIEVKQNVTEIKELADNILLRGTRSSSFLPLETDLFVFFSGSEET